MEAFSLKLFEGFTAVGTCDYRINFIGESCLPLARLFEVSDKVRILCENNPVDSIFIEQFLAF